SFVFNVFWSSFLCSRFFFFFLSFSFFLFFFLPLLLEIKNNFCSCFFFVRHNRHHFFRSCFLEFLQQCCRPHFSNKLHHVFSRHAHELLRILFDQMHHIIQVINRFLLKPVQSFQLALFVFQFLVFIFQIRIFFLQFLFL